jgi:DNA polymerase III subunit epsilon
VTCYAELVRLLSLDRPLVLFDLETTGIDPATDRIVEIACLRLEVDGQRQERTRRINPERPIPPGATAIHGIGDADVRDAPTFRQVAVSLAELLAGADLGGFNVLRFDLPLLSREFRDCGLDPGLETRRVVDAMAIYHRKERRDLAAAARFYLGREHAAAHAAEADLAVTLDVLEAQLERYPDLPRTVGGLSEWIGPGADRVDSSGKFVRREGLVVFAFGRHQGKPLAEIAQRFPDYLQWILGQDFPPDACELVRRALSGEPPA